MSAAWFAAPGLLGLGLFVMMLRRLISPARFAQALAGVCLGAWAVAALVGLVTGGGHGD